MKSTLPFLLCAFAFIACGEKEAEKQPEDRVQTQDISRDGAIETVVSTENDSINNKVLLITTHKVWRNNALINEFRKVDTIPSLNTPIEKKDYEFYITVK
jgi:hypothetical protein